MYSFLFICFFGKYDLKQNPRKRFKHSGGKGRERGKKKKAALSSSISSDPKTKEPSLLP